MSLLEQDTTRKGRVDEEVRQMEFDIGDDESGEYEVEAIWDKNQVIYQVSTIWYHGKDIK